MAKEKIPEPKKKEPLEIPQNQPTLQFLEEAALAGDSEAENLLTEILSDPAQMEPLTDFRLDTQDQ